MNEEHLEGDDRREPPQTGATAGSEGNAPRQSEGNGDRDELGRFARGNRYSVGKGRPPGSFDLVSLARKRAKRGDIDLRGELWSALRAMIEQAKLGDVNAARLVFEKLTKPVDKAPAVELHLEQNIAVGPPVPSGGELTAYIAQLTRVAAQLGLVPGEERPAQSEVTRAQLAPPPVRAGLAPLRSIALPAPRPRLD